MTTIRAPKTTRNQDDFRVLMAGTLFAIFLMVGTPTFMKLWDTFVSPRPFVSATLEIAEDETGTPFILYDADATQPVDGVWIASLEGEDGEQMITRRGNGSYSEKEDLPRPWTWFAFFDNEKGLNSPGLPNVKFRVCVRYIVTARDSGIHDETPTYCSPFYTDHLPAR